MSNSYTATKREGLYTGPTNYLMYETHRIRDLLGQRAFFFLFYTLLFSLKTAAKRRLTNGSIV